MKNLVKLNADDIAKEKFNGFTIAEIVQSTGQDLKGVTIVDLDGKSIDFIQSAYSDFAAYIAKPPQKKKMWTVAGKLDGVQLSTSFDTEAAASKWQPDLAERTQVEIEVLV